MKKMFVSACLFAFAGFFQLLLLFGCGKKNEITCPASFKISATTLTPTVGETLTLSASPERLNYLWNGPQNFFVNQTTGASTVSIENIKINQSGWYVGSLMLPGCEVRTDSLYIDVKYKQAAPPCTLINNQVTASSLPDLQASSVRKRYDNSWNAMSLYASGTFGNPTYLFLFNSYNGQAEPKDGIYITKDVQSFSPDDDANVLFGQCQYASYFFKTQPGQSVYVSHVNGKLRLAFCNLKYSGDNGNSVMVTATVNGQLTEN